MGGGGGGGISGGQRLSRRYCRWRASEAFRGSGRTQECSSRWDGYFGHLGCFSVKAKTETEAKHKTPRSSDQVTEEKATSAMRASVRYEVLHVLCTSSSCPVFYVFIQMRCVWTKHRIIVAEKHPAVSVVYVL